MTGRTKTCTTAFRVGRLRKANQFYEAAELIAEELPDASVDLFVDAGIAAADVICCARVGIYAVGDNHIDAVALLKRAEVLMERHLWTLLNLRSKIAYTEHPATAEERKKASRAAEAMIEAARRIASGS